MSDNKNLALELTRLVLDLELQRNEILSSKAVKKALCHCRRLLIDEFINTTQLLIVRFISKLIKFSEDMDTKKATIDELKTWFYTENMVKMCSSDKVNTKYMALIYILSRDLVDRFFAEFEDRFEHILNIYNTDDNKELFKAINIVFELLKEWVDEYTLLLVGIRLNCYSIKDEAITELYEHINIDHMSDFVCNAITDEALVLYISNSYEHKGYISIVDNLARYHKDIGNIDLVIDFQFMDIDVTAILEELLPAAVVFKSVKIKHEAASTGNNQSILIIDHNIVLLDELAAYLTELGFIVTKARTGEIALALFNTSIDLIVMDIGMSDISSLCLYTKIKQMNVDMPVLFMGNWYDTGLTKLLAIDNHMDFIRRSDIKKEIEYSIQRLTK